MILVYFHFLLFNKIHSKYFIDRIQNSVNKYSSRFNNNVNAGFAIALVPRFHEVSQCCAPQNSAFRDDLMRQESGK
jgi:hypothetical protein